MAHQFRKKALNRVDYETKINIIYDDRFKPVNKNIKKDIEKTNSFHLY